jgi:hypothetical protein
MLKKRMNEWGDGEEGGEAHYYCSSASACSTPRSRESSRASVAASRKSSCAKRYAGREIPREYGGSTLRIGPSIKNASARAGWN